MDPAEIVAIVAGAGLAPQVLGPTAEYVGQRLQDGVKATENYSRILLRAAGKLGSKIGEPGSVPPRVLRAVLDEAPFVDDTVATEYLAGILATSRSEGGEALDDRGVAIASCIQRLSTPSIRLHFLIYRAFVDGLAELSESQRENWRGKLLLVIPVAQYMEAMHDWSLGRPDIERLAGITAHSFRSLEREDLIKQHIGRLYANEGPPREVVISPTQLGEEMFSFACGDGKTQVIDRIEPSGFAEELPKIEGHSWIAAAKHYEEQHAREGQKLGEAMVRLLEERSLIVDGRPRSELKHPLH